MFSHVNGNYDQQLTADMRKTTKAVVGWILIASWCYYVDSNPCSLLSDQQFDKACAWLLRHYDTVEHKYKHLLPREALAAGTAYQLAMHQYPRGIIACAQQARRGLEGV